MLSNYNILLQLTIKLSMVNEKRIWILLDYIMLEYFIDTYATSLFNIAGVITFITLGKGMGKEG